MTTNKANKQTEIESTEIKITAPKGPICISSSKSFSQKILSKYCITKHQVINDAKNYGAKNIFILESVHLYILK